MKANVNDVDSFSFRRYHYSSTPNLQQIQDQSDKRRDTGQFDGQEHLSRIEFSIVQDAVRDMRSQDRYESEEEYPARPFPHEGLLGIFNDRQAPQPPVPGDRERDVPAHVQLYRLHAARPLHHDGVAAGGQLEFEMPLIPDLRGRAPVYLDGNRIGCEQCGIAADVGYPEGAHETCLHLSAFNRSLRHATMPVRTINPG